MMVGKKIKELRRKNDLTQEKLADYLCVSYQAVSKWETGVSSPDLSLIAPLTKLLRVSADELLGLNDAEPDKRRAELEEAYEKLGVSGDLEGRLKIVETAVNEYPGDLKYLSWLAATLYYNALENFEYGKEQDAELEKIIKICEMVIEESANEKVRESALQNIIQSLSWLQRYDEAKKYAEQYPENRSLTRDDMLNFCLKGEEKIKHNQKIMLNNLEALIDRLQSVDDIYNLVSAEQIIKLIITDGNYLNLHGQLYHINKQKAHYFAKNSEYEKAVAALETAYYHVTEYDKFACIERGIYKYTAPLLNRVEYDTREWYMGVPGTVGDGFSKFLNLEIFNPLREREDFKKLAENNIYTK
jgi:transcriptional regulator with XRE-family HTH domain